MKKMMKLTTGLALGAVLCLALLVGAPQPAEAAYWSCPDGTVFWCADVIFVNGVRYCNTSAWCPPRCYYTRC